MDETQFGEPAVDMEVNIFASVLRPRAGGEFLVIASVFPANREEPLADAPRKTGTAPTLEEALAKREELAASLCALVEQRGYRVRDVRLR